MTSATQQFLEFLAERSAEVRSRRRGSGRPWSWSIWGSLSRGTGKSVIYFWARFLSRLSHWTIKRLTNLDLMQLLTSRFPLACGGSTISSLSLQMTLLIWAENWPLHFLKLISVPHRMVRCHCCWWWLLDISDYGSAIDCFHDIASKWNAQQEITIRCMIHC